MVKYFRSERNRWAENLQKPKSKQQCARSQTAHSFEVIKKQNKNLLLLNKKNLSLNLLGKFFSKKNQFSYISNN